MATEKKIVRIIGGEKITGIDRSNCDWKQVPCSIAGLFKLSDLTKANLTIVSLDSNIFEPPRPSDIPADGSGMFSEKIVLGLRHWAKLPPRNPSIPELCATLKERLTSHGTDAMTWYADLLQTYSKCPRSDVEAAIKAKRMGPTDPDVDRIQKIMTYHSTLLPKVMQSVFSQIWTSVVKGGVAMMFLPDGFHCARPAEFLGKMINGFSVARSADLAIPIKNDQLPALPPTIDEIIQRHFSWSKMWPSIFRFRWGEQVHSSGEASLSVVAPGTGRSGDMTFVPASVDGSGHAKSLLMLAGEGGMLVMPPPDDFRDVVRILVSLCCSSEQTLPSGILRPQHKLKFTGKRVSMGKGHPPGWVVRIDGQEYSIGHKAFLLLLCFAISAVKEEKGINPNKPTIARNRLEEDIFRPRAPDAARKPAQQINKFLRVKGEHGNVIEVVPRMQSEPLLYRLNPSFVPDEQSFRKLQGPADPAIKRLLKLL